MIPTVWQKEVIRQARKGNDIYLSIDIDLQQSLDTTLKAVLQENGEPKDVKISIAYSCV